MLTQRFMICSLNRSRLIMGKGKQRYRQDRDWVSSDDDIFYPHSSSLPASLSNSFQHNYSTSMLKVKELKARNPVQERYMKLLETDNPPIVIANGVSGTGKTLIPNSMAIMKLKEGSIKKLIITRPAVESGSDKIGFLPGTLEEKMDPWLRPIYDVFYKYVTPQEIQNLIMKQVIEIVPLVYMRGRTFDNTWIICDESQNTTPEQMLMLLTRIGINSKLIINGDPSQHDRKFERNGLQDLLDRIKRNSCNENDISLVNFTENEVERHPVIKKVLKLYAPPSE